MANSERVIVFIGLDYFHCQVEEKLNPDIKRKPIAVEQYDDWEGSRISAVNSKAVDSGVTLHMRGDAAKKICPDLALCSVPTVRGRPDLTKYRQAGRDVAAVLLRFTEKVERISVDEAYIDITELVQKYIGANQRRQIPIWLLGTNILGHDGVMEFRRDIIENKPDSGRNFQLLTGAIITEHIRGAIYGETGFKSSAGIAHNKTFAKYACSLNMPYTKTVFPHSYVKEMYGFFPVKHIERLGGNFEKPLNTDLKITYMADLEKFPEIFLQEKYGIKAGSWLYNIARGIEVAPVKQQLYPQAFEYTRKFPFGLTTPENVEYWLSELAHETIERLNQELTENNRKTSNITICYSFLFYQQTISASKTGKLSLYDQTILTRDALELVTAANKLNNNQYQFPVTFLGFGVTKFEEITSSLCDYIEPSISDEKKSESRHKLKRKNMDYVRSTKRLKDF